MGEQCTQGKVSVRDRLNTCKGDGNEKEIDNIEKYGFADSFLLPEGHCYMLGSEIKKQYIHADNDLGNYAIEDDTIYLFGDEIKAKIGKLEDFGIKD